MRTSLYALAAILIAGPSMASAQGITGKWAVVWDADIRTDGDSAIVKSRKPATLELTQRGDSVVGVWHAGPNGGTQVRGTFNGRTLKLTSGANDSKGFLDGKPVTIRVRWDINGALQDGKLAGSLFLYMDNRSAPPRRWEAQRAP